MSTTQISTVEQKSAEQPMRYERVSREWPIFIMRHPEADLPVIWL